MSAPLSAQPSIEELWQDFETAQQMNSMVAMRAVRDRTDHFGYKAAVSLMDMIISQRDDAALSAYRENTDRAQRDALEAYALQEPF